MKGWPDGEEIRECFILRPGEDEPTFRVQGKERILTRFG